MQKSAVIVSAVLAVLCWGYALPTVESEMMIRVQAARKDIPALQEAGLYIYEVGPDYVRGAIAPSRLLALIDRKFQYEVLIPDMIEYHKQMAPGEDFGRYHSYQEIMDSFALVATNNPNICKLETLARSASGRYVIALKITENAHAEVHRPRMVWDGTTHGNENIGTEVCWYFMQLLVGQYGIDPLITQLVNTREIWLIPVINPDGLVNRTRGNSSVSDPNRDYGYAWNAQSGANVPWYSPEIRGHRNFFQRRPFVVSMTYHSGTTSVMWPWSYSQIATKDSVAHKELCDRYSSFTGYPSFQISRGLYECQGTSSDFTHGAEGALGLAAEIASGQPPPQSQIDTICRANWTASRDLMIRGAWGVRGVITDSITGAPVKRAIVVPNPPDWMTYADTCGWYFKYLRPGTYSIKVMADGYVSKTITGVTVPADTYVTVNFQLRPDSSAPITGYKVSTWICKSSSGAGSTMGFWTLGPRDSRVLTLTTRGMAVIELSRELLNGTGTDFTVYSTTSKPCSVFVSADSFNGPWRFCAYGTGNIACDLSNAGVALAKFVRLSDAGSSYDLDAIEGTVVNAPALTYQDMTIVDSTGNNNGRLDPGEQVYLIVGLRNVGRQPVGNVTGRLVTASPFVSIRDSTGSWGPIPPDSVRRNSSDRLELTALAGTPRGTPVPFTLYVQGTDYADSIRFTIVVGQITAADPIPDGPRTPPQYYAYDDIDSAYAQRPTYQWVEIKDIGTRLNLADDQTVQINLPAAFGPWKYYGQRYTNISICSNGWVAAGTTTSTAYNNTGLPSSSMTAPAVCLCWDDLDPPTGQGIWYYTDTANHRFVIEYDSVPHFVPSGDYEKFELIIYDTTLATPSGNNILVAQYYNAADYSSVTVGLQDPTNAIAIQVLFNGAYHQGAAPIHAGRAIKYSDQPLVGMSERTAVPAAGPQLTVLPNPVTGPVVIRYVLPRSGPVRLALYDAAGRLLRTIVDQTESAGNHSVKLAGAALPGVGFVCLETEEGTVTVKTVGLR